MREYMGSTTFTWIFTSDNVAEISDLGWTIIFSAKACGVIEWANKV